MTRFDKKQFEFVEFTAKVYHSGLRHTGINGSLYEDYLIKLLSEEISELSFYRGQIKKDSCLQYKSNQYDVIVCKKDTVQPDFLQQLGSNVNIIEAKNCLGVIELKKWGNPAMISPEGGINRAYTKFKTELPELFYYLVCVRFKDRKTKPNGNWNFLKNNLIVDQKFCFMGRTSHRLEEWKEWDDRIYNRHEEYFGELEKLIKTIKNQIR